MKRLAVCLYVEGETWEEVVANADIAKAASDKAARENDDAFIDNLSELAITIKNGKVMVEKRYVNGLYSCTKDRP